MFKFKTVFSSFGDKFAFNEETDDMDDIAGIIQEMTCLSEDIAIRNKNNGTCGVVIVQATVAGEVVGKYVLGQSEDEPLAKMSDLEARAEDEAIALVYEEECGNCHMNFAYIFVDGGAPPQCPRCFARPLNQEDWDIRRIATLYATKGGGARVEIGGSFRREVREIFKAF